VLCVQFRSPSKLPWNNKDDKMYLDVPHATFDQSWSDGHFCTYNPSSNPAPLLTLVTSAMKRYKRIGENSTEKDTLSATATMLSSVVDPTEPDYKALLADIATRPTVLPKADLKKLTLIEEAGEASRLPGHVYTSTKRVMTDVTVSLFAGDTNALIMCNPEGSDKDRKICGRYNRHFEPSRCDSIEMRMIKSPDEDIIVKYLLAIPYEEWNTFGVDYPEFEDFEVPPLITPQYPP
jgi:hypothetical protein